jgi:hypothetical protein
MNQGLSDAAQVLALCEASADQQAVQGVRRIIDDPALTPEDKAGFFKELRAALEEQAARAQRPLDVILRFMDGAGRKYMWLGEPTGEFIPDDNAPTYVRGLLQVALREQVSRVLIVPSGIALYRGAELHLVVPPPYDLMEVVFAYCEAFAALAASSGEPAATVDADGTLSPAGGPGIPARFQRVSNGSVSGWQIALG